MLLTWRGECIAGAVTRMKQIIINADDATHAWIAEQAKLQRRTIGNQALFVLWQHRNSAKPTESAKKGARK